MNNFKPNILQDKEFNNNQQDPWQGNKPIYQVINPLGQPFQFKPNENVFNKHFNPVQPVNKPVENAFNFNPAQPVNKPAENAFNFNPVQPVNKPENAFNFNPVQPVNKPAENAFNFNPVQPVNKPVENAFNFNPAQPVNKPVEKQCHCMNFCEIGCVPGLGLIVKPVNNLIVEKKDAETQVEDNLLLKEETKTEIDNLKESLLKLQIIEITNRLNKESETVNNTNVIPHDNVIPFRRKNVGLNFNVKPMGFDLNKPLTQGKVENTNINLCFQKKLPDPKAGLPENKEPTVKINYFVNNRAPKVIDPMIELYPSVNELERMSDEELREIKGFKIMHKKFGSIEFLGTTDVSEVYVDESVLFGQCMFELYPFKNFPKYNTKLNKRAIVTLYDCYSSSIRELIKEKSTDMNKFEELENKYKLRLIDVCKNNEIMEFISYSIYGGTWKFYIDYRLSKN
jgi:hypothetical protein